MTILKYLRTFVLASIFSLFIISTSAKAASSPQIRITEIMYDPPGTAVREFIEIYNGSDTNADLSGWSMSGVTYNFPNGTILAPGQYAVIANDESILQADHPSLDILGEYSGDLEGSGETIKILDQLGETASEVTYGSSSPWPSSPYDGGPTLSLIRNSADESMVECWSESSTNGGTPGALNSVANNNQTGCLDKDYSQTIVVTPPQPEPQPQPSVPAPTAPVTKKPSIKKIPLRSLPENSPPSATQQPQGTSPIQEQTVAIAPLLEAQPSTATSEQAKLTLKAKIALTSAVLIPSSMILLSQLAPTLASRARHKKLLKFKKGFKEL